MHRGGGETTREALIYAALHAFLDGDREFFFACEARWARTCAPQGPTLVELIALSYGLPVGASAAVA
jgi:hypothetical protein